MNRIKTLTTLEAFFLYSLLPFGLFGMIILPILGDSLFGLTSTFASSDSLWIFPISILFVQLLYSFVMYFGLTRANLIPLSLARLPIKVAQGSRGTIQPRDSLSRRTFIQKGILAAGVLVLTAYSLDKIISSIATKSPGGISNQQSTAIDLQDAPAIFSDPRLASLVDNEITPNNSFYRVAIDIFDPSVDASSGSLQVSGSVKNPMSYSLSDLQNSFQGVDQYNTFECVSNQINATTLIGNAKWTGVKISDILGAAGGANSGAQYVVFYSVDGYSVAIPLSKALMADSILAYMMNDQSLPQKHGYPLRAVIPGLYGMMSAKWINKIEVVDSPYQGYWQTRGWSNTGIVQTVSFITIPGNGSTVSLSQYGSVILGGMAYAGDRGISKVEVSVDGGNTWQTAELKKPLSNETWALWAFEWRPSQTGTYNIYARATDGTGSLQTSNSTNTFPNGATGYAMTSIRITS